MNIEITEADKKKAFEWAGHFWYIIVIMVLLIGILVLWQQWGSAKTDLNTVKSQITMQEDIKKTEERLNAMKVREQEYLTVFETQEKLNKTLADLEKKQKELQKLKKGNIANEIKKMDSNSLSSTFNSMGLPNTVVQ